MTDRAKLYKYFNNSQSYVEMYSDSRDFYLNCKAGTCLSILILSGTTTILIATNNETASIVTSILSTLLSGVYVWIEFDERISKLTRLIHSYKKLSKIIEFFTIMPSTEEKRKRDIEHEILQHFKILHNSHLIMPQIMPQFITMPYEDDIVITEDSESI